MCCCGVLDCRRRRRSVACINPAGRIVLDCEAAGGKFMPQIFGWMVHVYPFEQKPEDVWSVERQAHNHMD